MWDSPVKAAASATVRTSLGRWNDPMNSLHDPNQAIGEPEGRHGSLLHDRFSPRTGSTEWGEMGLYEWDALESHYARVTGV